MPRHNSEYAAGWLNRSFTSIGIPPLPGEDVSLPKDAEDGGEAKTRSVVFLMMVIASGEAYVPRFRI